MKEAFDDRISGLLCGWVAFVQRRARATAALCLVLTAVFGLLAARNLGINSDNSSLIAPSVPARAHYEALIEVFPDLENVLLLVVDGQTPELARNAARRLVGRLREEHERFREVFVPGLEPFFERHALLYRNVDELDLLADQIARVQPLLISIERDPTLARFADLVRDGLDRMDDDPETADAMAEVFDRFAYASARADDGSAIPVSWEALFLRGTGIESTTRQVVVVDPVLDYGSAFAAADAMAAVRSAVAALALDEDHGVRVRITGNPALNLEEMVGILWDVGIGGILCFFVVVLVLFRALRSIRLVLAAIVTLLCGLVWTTAFAALVIGNLSLLSVSFAILFIGLGVDFAIHLGMVYVDRQGSGLAPEPALRAAVRDIGSSLVLCTLTTAVGFYVFIPTDNLGVAELGAIAGTGMVVNLLLTLTIFPALLASWLRVRPGVVVQGAARFDLRWWRLFDQRPGAVLAAALLLALLGAAIAPHARFDANVIRLRDPDTESVQAFESLIEDREGHSPWPIEALAGDLPEAERWAARLAELETVARVTTLSTLVPDDQPRKLEILSDLSFLLFQPDDAAGTRPPPTSEERIQALRRLVERLEARSSGGEIGASERELGIALDRLLARLADDPDPSATLARVESILLSGLADEIQRLRAATQVSAVARSDLPPDVSRRLLAPDGRARIQVFPAETLSEVDAFDRFAASVLEVVPTGTGIAVNMVAFAEATRNSFFEALGCAAVLIGAILWLIWRRPGPPLLVMAPLALSSLLTVAATVVLDVPFNFANVVVVPLLLGIGVDSGIHLVHRAEHRDSADEELLATPTARAVFYSALTTMVSFGSLAFASHRGVSSLGTLLAVGMTLTLFSNLIVLPALLELRRRRMEAAGAG